MAEPRIPKLISPVARFGAAPTLLAMLLATQPGCTREFFREWANQDVSEAVFEKSRDPRWRLDTFSVEPPAMSRFADPYDQEFPPAPPDDIAAEALSPKPQSPDNRLLVPAEATGYIDMLEQWRMERDAIPKPPAAESSPTKPPTPSEGPSPFSPEGAPIAPEDMPELSPPPILPPTGPTTLKLGPRDPSVKPVLLADARPGKTALAVPPPRSADNFAKSTAPTTKTKSTVPPPRSAESFAKADAKPAAKTKDGAVRPVAMQNAEPDVSIRGIRPGEVENIPPGIQSPYVQPPVAVPLDPNPQERDIGTPGLPRPSDMVPEGPEGMMSEEQASELASVLIPVVPDLNEAQAAGLPSNSNPYKITMQQAFTLALINSRFYQTQLENLYSAALNVTLQRFAFQPQFYAGLTPLSAPVGAGFPSLNPRNSFDYRTRYAPGGQISALQLGEIAGFGKLLSSGGQLLMGFANQVVFNFVGVKPGQPTVQSTLPLSFVQPFLRGGGRAVVLESLTLAERSLLYQVRAFAKFRQEFIVSILTGGSIPNLGASFSLSGFSTGGNSDPVVGFIPLVVLIEQIDINRKNVAYFEQLVMLYKELIEGEASGLTKLQVDQAEQRLVSSRGTLVQSVLNYRNQLDQYKMQLGLPPDLPLIIDMNLTQGFRDVYGKIDDWQREPDRDLADLPGLVEQVPSLQDVVIDGRSILSLYRESETYTDDDQLEDILQAGVRTALEYRLDLMNTRAQLYDAWRQIRFQANSLRGILNVGVTNQVITPPTTTNPFGFFSQATSLSLVLQTELPLIRLAERNNFRQALINYQRQRRALQNAEDTLKFQIRQDIRNMQVAYINYQIAKRNLVLNIQLKDQAFEQIIAPPAGAAGSSGVAQSANAATQTSNLINFQGQVVTNELQLISGWRDYQLARLTLYRDLGTLPYDEWEAFSELFPAEYRGPSLGPGTSDTRPAALAEAGTP